MKAFEGGAAALTNEQQDAKRANRAKLMDATAWATALFSITLFIIVGSDLLRFSVGVIPLLTWAVLVSPILFVNGIRLRTMRQHHTVWIAERMTKCSVVLMTAGAISLSVLSAVVSFVYCSAEISRASI